MIQLSTNPSEAHFKLEALKQRGPCEVGGGPAKVSTDRVVVWFHAGSRACQNKQLYYTILD